MSRGHKLADDTVAVVLAGGKGTRLGALTRDVCKPALPFGASYRNIDFSLSNCMNSGIRRVGVATQHRPEALLRHLDAVWGDFNMARQHFIEPWPSEQRAPISGYRGTADAVYRNLAIIEKLGSRRVLVLAGDHVYKMDYRPLLEYHCRRRADVTVGCVEVPVEEANQFGVLSTDGAGRINRFIEKPKMHDELPSGGNRVLASMGIYVFETAFLAQVLRRDAFSNRSRHDFGGDIVPGLLRDARAFGYRFRRARSDEPAYWRDIGTPTAYWRAHMDLVGAAPRFRLDDPDWPIVGAIGVPMSTARYASPERRHAAALVASDCEVRGNVHHSVLFSGAVVSEGADVTDSVILPGAVVGRNCRLRGVVVDSGCRIPDGWEVNRSWRGTSRALREAPVILTAEDVHEKSLMPGHDRRLSHAERP